MANPLNESVCLIKDLKPGLKNINLVFIVLETGKSYLKWETFANDQTRPSRLRLRCSPPFLKMFLCKAFGVAYKFK